jgi:hypothetical protein
LTVGDMTVMSDGILDETIRGRFSYLREFNRSL